jgi:hypothetical protein
MTIKKILKTATEILCTNTCRFPCNTYLYTYTLAIEIANRINQNFTHNPIIVINILEINQNPPKLPKEMLNLKNFPITSINNKKTYERKDKYGSTKKFTSYKCQWELPNNEKYATWIPTDKLFPYKDNTTFEHNLTKLTQYYQLK